jgi:pimeloyl-ACP methyl ester carboxylesterase
MTGSKSNEELCQWVTPDGLASCYRIRRCKNTKATVILLHGLASNMTRWSEFVEYTSLPAQWNVIRVDLRGHGCSVFRGKLTRKKWCDDLRALLQREGVTRGVFVGHSLGAQIALELAASHAELVQGLILLDPVFPDTLTGKMEDIRRHGFWIRMLAIMSRGLNALGLYRRKLPYRDLRQLDERTREILAAAEDQDIADLYMSPREDLKYIPTTIYFQELCIVVEHLPDPTQIAVPVRVLLSAGGSTSQIKPLRDKIAGFPDGQCVDIDADHWMLTEKPEKTRETIEMFCAQLAATRSAS